MSTMVGKAYACILRYGPAQLCGGMIRADDMAFYVHLWEGSAIVMA